MMCQNHNRPRLTGRARAGERGVVLIYALLGLMLVAGIVAAGSLREVSTRKDASLEFEIEGHARQMAESGIVDGIAWLRSRPSQPVLEFAPKRDMSKNPPINETDDPSRGLIREVEISSGYWGRYVVHLAIAEEPFTDWDGDGVYDEGEPFEDLDGNGRRTIAGGSRDVSALRGVPAPGTVWYLESTGSIYRRYDASQPLGTGRNAQLASMTIGSEVRRLTVVIPTSAAVVIADAKKASIEGTYIVSPVLGVGHRKGRFQYKTKLSDPRRIDFDTPAEAARVPTWITSGVGTPSKDRIRVEDIFGVGIDTLKAMADYSVESLAGIGGQGAVITDPVLEEVAGVITQRLPYTMPDGAFVVITPPSGEIIFDKAHSLIGRGVVVVNGDMTVTPDTNSDFSGILYVTGDLTIDRSGVFKGTIIAGRELDINGTLPVSLVKSRKTKKTRKTGKTLKSRSIKVKKTFKTKKTWKSLKIIPEESVYVGHDPALVDEFVAQLGRYRRWKSSYRPVPIAADGRPDEYYRTGARTTGN